MAENKSFKETSSLDKYTSIPGNSYKSKAERELEEADAGPKLSPVTSGTKQKKSLSTKIRQNFLSEESDTVGSYIIWDVLIPAAKDTLADLVTGAINMILFGDGNARSGGRKSSRRNGYRDYSSSTISYKDSKNGRPERSERRNRKYAEEILITDTEDMTARQAAMQIISDMQDAIADYGKCLASDYYYLCGVDYDYTDKLWCWRDLEGVRARPVRGGFIIDLPEMEPV